ncbi:MAG: helix-turn-helix domain-containing protein [Bacteroidales bacterium]
MYYLYVYKICSGSLKIKTYELFHLIPFLIFLISSFTFYYSVYFTKILAGSSSVLGLSYCFITLYTLRRHLVNVRNQFSFTEKVNLSWLNKLVFGLILLWFGVVILVFLNRIFNYEFSLYWFYISIPIFIFYIGFNGIKQQNIYSFHISIPEKAGYKNSGLRENQKQEIYEKLLNAMDSKKLFTNSRLSLQNLSNMLNIPPHHITQTLNEFVKQNFYDFVNSYRVNEFKKRVDLGDSERFSLLGIALDCGFNSKSSFNRIFKNMTGLTPSEYRIKQI